MGIWKHAGQTGDAFGPNITMHVMTVDDMASLLLLPDKTEVIVVQVVPGSGFTGMSVEHITVDEGFRTVTQDYITEQGDGKRHPIAFVVYRLPDGLTPDDLSELTPSDDDTEPSKEN